MSRRSKLTDTTPFDTLRLEGSIFVPELLERVARGEAPYQKEADYTIPKGLKLQDEYGRSYRIASALWQDFAPQLLRTDIDPAKITHAFVLDLLRQCLGYTDLSLTLAPVQLGDRGFPITAQASGGRIPVIIAPHKLALDDPDPCFAVLGAGARRKSAHQLAQEFLNASRECLWAIVTNGRTLRLLRDAETLTRPNFLEFDLETILREGEARYSDFSALWRILHASRAGSAAHQPAECIWEKWKTEGHAQGLRVRDGLRDGVTQALLILGTGFIAHRENDSLRQQLQDGTLTKEDYFQQLLRLIYRCLFLFCAEERDLLHAPAPADPASLADHAATRKVYAEGYSLRRLRNRSLRQSAHDSHGDLWQGQTIVFRALAIGQPKLALPALGGLFAETQCPNLDSASLANRDLLAAMRHLRWSSTSGSLTAIDYRNMGPEELGSVYESLLELVPQLDLPARTFGFVGITTSGSTSGNARKTTGSYYTPDSLVQELIKSALDPVIADRLKARPDNPVEALLSITVCDPSCGSGHFLLAASRRLAEKLAELRAPDGAVRPDDYRHALREVASRCLYGVDINPMAVELCRVALWLETVDPGKPLGFLNHHIRTGNSLLGTTPDLIAAGLPDDTFTAIEGDDKAACAELKKRNKKEREGFGPLFEQEEQTIRDRLRHAATQIEAMDDSQPAALQQKEAAFTTSETAPEYRHAKLLADLWCAAFVIKKHYPAAARESQISNPQSQIAPVEGHLLHTQDELFGQPTAAPAPAKAAKQPRTKNQEQGTASGITTGTLRNFVQGQALPEALEKEVTQLASQYRFFHWHLAFPQVFDQGGFACILGNPPWERVKLQEQEFFASKSAVVESATNAAERKRLIAKLQLTEPRLWSEWMTASRVAEAQSHFVRRSGYFPFCGKGDVNTYALFAEHNRTITNAKGRVGLILPTGIATDDTTKDFFGELVARCELSNFYSFENEDFVFPSVHHAFRFAILTVDRSGRSKESDLVFFARQVEDLLIPDRHFTLAPADFAALNPNTRTCPTFRSRADADLNLAIYRRTGVFIHENAPDGNPWSLDVRTRLWHMAEDAQYFSSRTELVTQGWSLDGNSFIRDKQEMSPLFEAKMVHHFDHRFGTYEGQTQAQENQGKLPELDNSDHSNPYLLPLPYYWVPTDEMEKRLDGVWNRNWLLGWRDVTGSTVLRTVVVSLLPRSAVGHKLPLMFPKVEPRFAAVLYAMLSSFVLDYSARQKVGGLSLSFFMMKQFPVLPPSAFAMENPWHCVGHIVDWLLPRVLELTYTAWDLEAFASDCGWSGPPFRWNEERRFLLRCELDAAFFHLYLGRQSEWQQQPEALTRAFPTPRHAVSYIMDTFPIVKRKDEAKHGHYRTKEVILQIYDAIGQAMQSGVAYQTLLNPAPASFRVSHRPRLPQENRIHLTQARAYWLEFLLAVAQLAGEELTLERLWEAYLIVLGAGELTAEAQSVLGEDSAAWIASLAAEPTEPGVFADMLETLNANGKLHRRKVGDQVFLSLSSDIPAQPDKWRFYDAAAALAIHLARPAAVKFDLAPSKPVLQREVVRFEALERKFA